RPSAVVWVSWSRAGCGGTVVSRVDLAASTCVRGIFYFCWGVGRRDLCSFPARRSSDLVQHIAAGGGNGLPAERDGPAVDCAVVRRRRRQSGAQRVGHGDRARGRARTDVPYRDRVGVGGIPLTAVARMTLADRHIAHFRR